MLKDWTRDQFRRKTSGMSQFLAQAQYQQGNANIIHQWSSDPDIQAIIHQWASDQCLSSTPVSTPLTIVSSPVTIAWFHQLGEYQTRARKISTNTHKQQAQQWGIMGKCPETGHRGDRIKKANMAQAIGRGLNCGWVEPTKPLLHNTN